MVDIDPATGAPIIKPFDAAPTSKPEASKDAKDNDNQTTNQGSSQKQPETVKETNVEALEKKVEDLRVKANEAVDAAHAAHTELMDAQRALAFAKAH